jgi:hypothetical protein
LFNVTGNAPRAQALPGLQRGARCSLLSTNTANGESASLRDTTGSSNTAIGAVALVNNTTGSLNTVIGIGALNANSTGNSNTAVGQNAGNGITTASKVIAIGTSGANVSNSCFIGHIRGVQTSIGDAIPVLIDSAGQLGTMSSSRRFKTNIKPMDNVSEAVLALKPVTFHYKSDKTNTSQFGLIAEEVAELNPELVVRDKDGVVDTVRYEQVNMMFLTNFSRSTAKSKNWKQPLRASKSKSTRLLRACKR